MTTRKTGEVVKVGISSRENFFKRGRVLAKKADKKEPLKPSHIISFEDPADLAEFLSQNKINIILELRKAPLTVKELSVALNRDRTAIEKDLKILVDYGVIECHKKPNPGHGQQKVLTAVYDEPLLLQVAI